jgi:hypothetical protein
MISLLGEHYFISQNPSYVLFVCFWIKKYSTNFCTMLEQYVTLINI